MQLGCDGRFVEGDAHLPLAHRSNLGEPHAVSGQYAGQWMQQHAPDAERVGDQAGVLSAGAAEAVERVFGHVVTALHRDLLDRVRHILDRNAKKSGRNAFGGRRRFPLAGDSSGQLIELRYHNIAIERFVPAVAKNSREIVGLNLAEHNVAVGNGQRTAAAVAGGPGIGAGRIGADAKSSAVELQHRASARSHGVDAQHRRPHAHAGHQRLEAALVFTVEMGDIG